MFAPRTLTSALFAASVLFSSAFASPTPIPSAAAVPTSIQPHEFDVYLPAITSPNATTVWHTGETQVVAWSTKSLDAAGRNATGYLLLGYLENDSENLDIKHPLARGFFLGDGQTTVTVPDVITRDNYIVVLLGDSGNASPTFTIQNTSAPSASASASATA